VVTEHNNRTTVWATQTDDSDYTVLDEKTIEELVEYMETNGDMGRNVVSYNGSSFDFQLLATQSKSAELKARIYDLAKNHVDLHLACIVARGHRMKMDGLAKASLGTQKSGTGANAVRLWEEKKYNELFSYCRKDVEILRDLFDLAKLENSLQFESARGNLIDVDTTGLLEQTAFALSNQAPHKESWMTDNAGLAKVLDWLPESHLQGC
jgi:uncharacterized protein YprB with RNaseH-like and TPR domain